jgi:hypothetical protein
MLKPLKFVMKRILLATFEHPVITVDVLKYDKEDKEEQEENDESDQEEKLEVDLFHTFHAKGNYMHCVSVWKQVS